jgi:hypothetical protein
MWSVALPTKEAITMWQTRGHEGAMLVMKFNHDGKYNGHVENLVNSLDDPPKIQISYTTCSHLYYY